MTRTARAAHSSETDSASSASVARRICDAKSDASSGMSARRNDSAARRIARSLGESGPISAANGRTTATADGRAVGTGMDKDAAALDMSAIITDPAAVFQITPPPGFGDAKKNRKKRAPAEKNGVKMSDMKNRRVIVGDAELRHGDCGAVLADLPSDSVDLIVTSPPYAERRRSTYGGVPAGEYVEWFLPKSAEFLRVLKPDGTFILNIKEHAEKCERSVYVLELVLALREQGWLWTEEFVWHKKNAYPGRWPNRFRDAWERLLQFNKTRRFKMYQDAVKVPVGEWAENRLRKLGKNDGRRTVPATGSGMGRNISNWVGKREVLPSNVLHMAGECGNRNHSAVFPESLPEWFVKLFTQRGDLVLDPFMGSGTTVVVASAMGRRAVGADILSENIEVAYERLVKSRPPMKSRPLRTKKTGRAAKPSLPLNQQVAARARKVA